jgi:hypothetical protein
METTGPQSGERDAGDLLEMEMELENELDEIDLEPRRRQAAVLRPQVAVLPDHVLQFARRTLQSDQHNFLVCFLSSFHWLLIFRNQSSGLLSLRHSWEVRASSLSSSMEGSRQCVRMFFLNCARKTKTILKNWCATFALLIILPSTGSSFPRYIFFHFPVFAILLRCLFFHLFNFFLSFFLSLYSFIFLTVFVYFSNV